MKKLSLITCGLFLGTNVLLATDDFSDTTSLASALENGKVTGSLALYNKNIYRKKAIEYNDGNFVKRAGYTNGNIAVGYETGSLNGFSAKVEVKGNINFGELHNDDRESDESPLQNNALLTEVYLKYANDTFFIKVGRQSVVDSDVDLEWLDYYQEGIFAGITAIPDTIITLGWTQKRSESDYEMSENFWRVNEYKGIYVADVKYSGLPLLVFNPYYYNAPDLANWYGLKVTVGNDNWNFIAHYVKGHDDAKLDLPDEGIMHFEANMNVDDFTASLGHFRTDSDGGAMIMSNVGDHISPFEDGYNNYEVNARTTYGSLGYTIADTVTLGAIYGQTIYDVEGYHDEELNISAEYKITESFSASVLYVKLITDNDDITNYDKYIATVSYTF